MNYYNLSDCNPFNWWPSRGHTDPHDVRGLSLERLREICIEKHGVGYMIADAVWGPDPVWGPAVTENFITHIWDTSVAKHGAGYMIADAVWGPDTTENFITYIWDTSE